MKREELEKLAAEGGSVRIEAKAYMELQDAVSALTSKTATTTWRVVAVLVGGLVVLGVAALGIGTWAGLVAWGYHLVAP